MCVKKGAECSPSIFITKASSIGSASFHSQFNMKTKLLLFALVLQGHSQDNDYHRSLPPASPAIVNCHL